MPPRLPQKNRPDFCLHDDDAGGTYRSERAADWHDSIPGEIKNTVGALQPLARQALACLRCCGDKHLASGETPLEPLHKRFGRQDLAHRNCMDPYAPAHAAKVHAFMRDVGGRGSGCLHRHSAQPLAHCTQTFAGSPSSQRVVWRKDQQPQRRERDVEKIHSEGNARPAPNPFRALASRIIVAAAQNAHNFPRARRIARQIIVRILSILLAISLLSARPFARMDPASQQSSTQTTHTARPLPQDSHEGMTLSADPYTDSARAKEKFGKGNPLPEGILPVDVFLRNDTNQPIRIDLSTVQLAVHFASGKSQEIDWLAVYEVARAIVHPNGSPAPKVPRFPLGVPSQADSKVDKVADVLRPLTLDADIVPPMGAIHGFLFFDIGHDFSLARRCSLYLPDAVTVPSNKPLVFFEVPLGDAPSTE